MPSSYNLSEIDKKKIDALVRSGFYSSKSDVVRDALRCLLENKKTSSVVAAVKIYKSGKVSLGKASEKAGIGLGGI